ncbi:MAG TPA: bifunctional YncE family protein/alkaline phosphatase family protein, partial [Jatrophihabitans sp.]|nr:bifunctional YncE family protein/alkaline phosphatase family protein [Jatrophihabitans sp.]
MNRSRRRLRGLTVATASVGVALLATGVAAAAAITRHDQVGQTTARGVVLPDNQTVSPLGVRTLTTGGRLLSSDLAPGGGRLAALSYRNGTGFLSIFDTKHNKLLQQVGTGNAGDPKIGDGSVAADGPIYSPDGATLWVPQTADLLRFSVNPDGTVQPTPVKIPMLNGSTPLLPSGGAFSQDGKTLYLALNNVNAVGYLDTTTNTLVRQVPVGVAPRQVALVGGKLYVSNEGGRVATAKDFTNLTSGTPVAADKSTGAVNNGTVSVLEPASGAVSTLKVGLEPTALYAHGSTLFVANSNNDSITLIDTAKQRVAQTVNVNPLPGSTVGSYPNAITMPDADHVYVSIGRDNAIAVYRYNGSATAPLQYEGLIPTDWYPVNVAKDPATGKIVVTNDKGIGARGLPKTISEGPDANAVTGLNTYSDTGSVTTFSAPTEADLGKLTHTVFIDNDWQKLLQRSVTAATNAAPAVLPVKLGAPSKIKHVFLLVKENRTYDQVLGDIGKGDSDPSYTQFGASVTPNEHALANQFGLFDNFYDEGTLSADGHNWLMQADANDYIEKEFGAFYRSYPAQGGDALAYQRNGFLWNAAEAAGNTVANFGEYNNFFTADNDPNRPTWAQWYQDSLILEGKASGPLPVPTDKYKTYADIPSLNKITDPSYPKFDTDVPDQYRTDIWLKSFQQ